MAEELPSIFRAKLDQLTDSPELKIEMEDIENGCN
jgi:hypothetical protein